MESIAGTSASNVCEQRTACIVILCLVARLRLLRWIVGLQKLSLVEFARNLAVLRVFTILSCQTALPLAATSVVHTAPPWSTRVCTQERD